MHLRTKLNQNRSLTLFDSVGTIYHNNIKLAILDSKEVNQIKTSVYLYQTKLVISRYFLAGPGEDKAACQVEVMTCSQKSLQLLAAFVGVLLALGIGANFPLPGKFFRCNPFVRFTDLKGFTPVRFADACLVKRMRDTAGAVAATGKGRSLVLGV